ncbi:uncharacterized protein [Nicotiana tomentosiformis]|uniref:uncharacterized protein n=1 Tax=Nicotiana tomentosiformis TaxID=4098 RepID=UPI00388C9DA4
MYHDLKEVYGWNDMKRDVARCPNCQQVKAEHQKSGGLAQNIEIPMWKWEMINIDFVALYGRSCRSPIGWFEVVEAELIGLDLIYQDMERVKIIKERLKTAQNLQKSYSDVCRRDLEFKDDDCRIDQVAYRLELPPEILLVRPVFGDPSLIVPVEAIEVNEEFTYEEIPVVILDRQVQKLRNKETASVKVLW